MAATFALFARVYTQEAAMGGEYEQRGYVAVHGSFGTHRYAECHALPANEETELSLGTFELPADPALLRGDEHVWVQNFALTRKSGIDAIDAKEGAYVVRSVAAGVHPMSVAALLDYAAFNPPHAAMEETFYDTTLLSALAAEQQAAAGDGGAPASSPDADTQRRALLGAATKGRLSVRIEMNDVLRGRLDAYRARFKAAALRSAESPHLLYGSARMLQTLVAAKELVMAAHSTYFFADPVTGGPPRFPIGAEASLDALHLVSYDNMAGWLPAGYYTLNSNFTRPPLTALPPAHATFYEPTAESARFFELQLAASLRRAGMSADTFRQAIAAQHAPAQQHALRETSAYTRARMAILRTCTYAANACNYTSDLRYANRAATAAQALPAPAATAAAAMAACWPHARSRRAHMRAGKRFMTVDTARLAARFLRADKQPAADGTTTGSSLAHPVEDFGIGLLAGTTASDDCEGDDTFEAQIALDMQHVGERFAQPGSLLAAATSVLQRYVVCNAAASVTSSYVNTEGVALTRKDLPDLPMIGDAVDQRSEIGGHCHGLMLPCAVMAAQLAAGGHHVARDLPTLHKAASVAAAWEKTSPVLVLEGTGATNPSVLPIEEVMAGDQAALTEAQATRALYATLRDQAPTLTDAAKLEGLNFYDTRQPAERRVSPFYRGVAFIMAPALASMNSRYQVVGLVHAPTRTRGAEIGALLRRPTDFALTSPYADEALVPAASWKELVEPLAACVLNQLPLSVFARFRGGAPAAAAAVVDYAIPPPRATFREASARLNHTLSDTVVASFARCLDATHPRSLAEALENLSLAATPTERPVPALPATRDERVLALYTQPWRLALPGASEAIQRELAALKAAGTILGHRFVRNRPVAQCVDTIEIHLLLPPVAK